LRLKACIPAIGDTCIALRGVNLSMTWENAGSRHGCDATGTFA
jgi:hypothetical protein